MTIIHISTAHNSPIERGSKSSQESGVSRVQDGMIFPCLLQKPTPMLQVMTNILSILYILYIIFMFWVDYASQHEMLLKLMSSSLHTINWVPVRNLREPRHFGTLY